MLWLNHSGDEGFSKSHINHFSQVPSTPSKSRFNLPLTGALLLADTRPRSRCQCSWIYSESLFQGFVGRYNSNLRLL